VSELEFFMAARITEGRWIYRFAADTGRASRAGAGQPDLPFIRLQTALRLRPRRALSSAEARTASIHQDVHASQSPTVIGKFQF
jgi:hypothetical protein